MPESQRKPNSPALGNTGHRNSEILPNPSVEVNLSFAELKYTDALTKAKWRETWRISLIKMQLSVMCGFGWLVDMRSQDSKHSAVIKRTMPDLHW